jgi:hypothetical protein
VKFTIIKDAVEAYRQRTNDCLELEGDNIDPDALALGFLLGFGVPYDDCTHELRQAMACGDWENPACR